MSIEPHPRRLPPPLPLPPRLPSRKRRLLLAGLFALVLLGGSGALWYGLTRSAGGSATRTVQPAASPEPLRGELIVRVWTRDRHKRGLRIGVDPFAVPFAEDEQLHLKARLNQPAYVYLLQVDGKGNVQPLYPWNVDEIEQESLDVPPPPQTPRETVHNPSKLDWGWRADKTEGLDTVLLLARRTPLPADRRLLDLLGKVRPAPLGPHTEVVVRGLNDGKEAGEVRMDQNRAFKKQAEEVDDQLLQLMARLKDDFELIRAVQYAHVAK